MIEKAMISQPMSGKIEKEIYKVREKAIDFLEKNGYEVVDTLFTDEWVNENIKSDNVSTPLFFLAKSIEKMSKCNAVYFCKGWEEARGCKIEHECAKMYGLKIIYEEG